MKNAYKYIFIFTLALLLPLHVLAQDSSSRANPVIWKTAYNEFSSSDFYIQIGDKRFLGSDRARVHSDPGLDKSTLELDWEENGIGMRMNLYFEKVESGMWHMYELRTYNDTGSDWINYKTSDTNGNPVRSLVGHRDFNAYRTFKSDDGTASIYCKDCSITAFMGNSISPSASGYAIDFRIGIPQNETITITNDPSAGYGVNAILMDSSGSVVTDQTDFFYTWKPENSSILSILPRSLPYPDGNCAYGVLAPCPEFNLEIKGISPGISKVLLDVTRRSDAKIVASNDFTVRVIEKNSNQFPTPTSVQGISPTPPKDDVTSELRELRGEVGRLKVTVQQQQTDIGLIQQIIQSIQAFLGRLFGQTFK